MYTVYIYILYTLPTSLPELAMHLRLPFKPVIHIGRPVQSVWWLSTGPSVLPCFAVGTQAPKNGGLRLNLAVTHSFEGSSMGCPLALWGDR